MAVLMDFAIFPTDKGAHVSHEVTLVVDYIKKSGFTFQLTAMGTLVETDTVAQALKLVEEATKILEPGCNRMYLTLKMDIKPGANQMLVEKVKSVERKL